MINETRYTVFRTEGDLLAHNIGREDVDKLVRRYGSVEWHGSGNVYTAAGNLVVLEFDGNGNSCVYGAGATRAWRTDSMPVLGS